MQLLHQHSQTNISKIPAVFVGKSSYAANSSFCPKQHLKIITYPFHSLAEQPFKHMLSVIGVENLGMDWKLELPWMPSWKKRKSKLNEIMHAKRMFNQRAKRKLEITVKRKPPNVVQLQSVCFESCLCVCLYGRGGVTCLYTLDYPVIQL